MGRTYRKRRRKCVRQLPTSLHSSPCFIRLTKWMKQHGWTPTCMLTPVDFYDTGRGLMTKTGIARNQVIMSIPVQLLITPATVAKSEVGRLISRDSGMQLLATFLVWEKHLGHHSLWEPYLNSLPSHYSTPLYCSDEELCLLPPIFLEPILAQREKVLQSFSDLKIVCGLKCWHCSESVDTVLRNEKLYQWAWCTVNTRCVYLNEQVASPDLKIKDNCLALAPYLDMFNHSNGAAVEVGLSAGNNYYEIRTLIPFSRHTQVFIHYGHHSNLKLYIEYGFFISSNPHDFIPFSFEEVVNAVKVANPTEFNCSSLKTTFLEDHRLTENLSCNFDGLSFNVKAVICVLVTDVSGKDVLAHKIYSCDFIPSEHDAICNVGRYLIKHKILEFKNAYAIMEEKKRKGCTPSFEIATDLMLEYMNLLKTAEKTVV
ncbi:SET domain-containing protein 4 [Periplaneta americana]|uniref:SET domain-containing protein 4 n=1 Tax=Periplaneta americana TaxID=6978 RepID=UPI0037E7EE08